MLKRFSYRSLLLEGFAHVQLPLLLTGVLLLIIHFLTAGLYSCALMLTLIAALKQMRINVSYTFYSLALTLASLYFLDVVFVASLEVLSDISIPTAVLTDSGILKALALCALGFGSLYGGIRLLFMPFALLEGKTLFEAFYTTWAITRNRALELYLFYVLRNIPLIALIGLWYYMVAIIPIEWSILICLVLTAYIVAAIAEAYCALYQTLKEASEATLPRS